MADTQQNILINIDLETGQVNSQLDQIDSKINNLGNGAKLESFKSVRTQIREAREEAVRLAIAIEDAEAAGQNVDNLSKRYAEVTSRAAQLNDAVDEVNQSISNANPDNRLQGLASIAQGAITAVQGVAGAFALVGVDAETAQVAIARLQGLLALTDAISSIDDIVKGYRDLKNVINLAAIAQKANNAVTVAAAAIQATFTGAVTATGTAFKALRVAIASTGIGLLVVAITAAIVAIASWISSSKEAEEQANRQKEALDRLTQAYEDETREIDAANKKKLLQLRIQGATEARIRQEQYAQAKIARDRALKQELDLEKQAGVTTEQLAAARKARIDAQNALEIQGLENELATAEDGRKKRLEIENKKSAEITKEVEGRKKKEEDAIKEINEFTAEETEKQRRKNLSAYEIEVADIRKKYDRIIALAKAFGKNTNDLEKLRNAELQATANRFQEEGENIFIQRQLEATRAKVKGIADEVIKELSKVPGTASEEAIRKILTDRSDELEKLFRLGAALKRKQLANELEISKKEINNIVFEGTPEEQKAKREALIKIATDNYEAAVKAVKDEVETEGESLRKATELTLLEVNIKQSEENVKKAGDLLAKLLVPFRKISDEAFIKRNIGGSAGVIFAKNFFDAVREAFTSVDLSKELNATKAFRQRIDAINEASRRKNQELDAQNQIKLFEFKADQAAEEILLNDTQLKRLQNLRISDFKSLQDFQSARLDLERLFQSENTALAIKQGQDRKNFEKKLANEINVAKQTINNENRNNEFQAEREFRTKIEQIRNPLSSITAGEKSLSRGGILTSKRFKEQFDSLLTANKDYYDTQIALENADFERQIRDAQFNNQKIEEIQKRHKQNLLDIENGYFGSVKIINDAALQSRLELYDAIGAGLGQLGQLFNKNKKVQAGFALAEIAINTATGFMRGLSIAQKTADAAGPGAAFAFPIFYAQQVASVLAAANRAKQIISSLKDVDTGGGGNTSGPAATPTAINASLFNLPPQAQDVRVVNQASQVVRAYITNDDLRSAQEKQAFLNKLSSF